MATFKVLTAAAFCGATFYLLLPTTVSSPTVGIPTEPSTIGSIPQFGLGTWLSDRDKVCARKILSVAVINAHLPGCSCCGVCT